MDDEFGDWGECSSEFVVVDFEGSWDELMVLLVPLPLWENPKICIFE